MKKIFIVMSISLTLLSLKAELQANQNCNEADIEWHSPEEVAIKNKIADLERDPAKYLELSQAYTEYGRMLLCCNKDWINSKKYFLKGRECVKKVSFESAVNTFLLATTALLQRNYSETEHYLFECYEIKSDFFKENSLSMLADTSQFAIWETIKAEAGLNVIYGQLLNSSEAEEHLQEKIKEFKENGRQKSLILAYELYAAHYVRQNDLENAIKCYESIEKLTDDFDFTQVAHLYEKKSDWNQAIKWYNKALESEVGDIPFIYIALGICKTRLHQFDEAKNAYLAAQKIYKENGDLVNEAGVINCIAYLHFLKGEADLSIKHGLEALNMYKKSGSAKLEDYYSVYDTLACAYEFNGRLDLAEESFLKAIAIGKSLGLQGRYPALKYISLGNVYLKGGKIEEAREYWRESLQYLDETKDADLVNKIKRNLEQNPLEIPRIEQYKL